jgi:hypothetical protein
MQKSIQRSLFIVHVFQPTFKIILIEDSRHFDAKNTFIEEERNLKNYDNRDLFLKRT